VLALIVKLQLDAGAWHAFDTGAGGATFNQYRSGKSIHILRRGTVKPPEAGAGIGIAEAYRAPYNPFLVLIVR
jgi:hypothetical protein